MSGYPTGIKAGAGLTKESVNYRHMEKCGTCNYFYPLNSCRIVDGNISPEGVCDKYEIVEKKGPKTKSFYEEEYNKTKGES